MDMLVLVRQGLLFVHLVAFAIALSAVLREDWHLIRGRSIDVRRLAATARVLVCMLGLLWGTGLALVAFEVGLDFGTIAARPKLAAKLFVVSVLTANGLALHRLAFPALRRAGGQDPFDLGLPAVLGAISSASWLYASFVGISRLVSPAMHFTDYLALYAAALAGAAGAALLLTARASASARKGDAGGGCAVRRPKLHG